MESWKQAELLMKYWPNIMARATGSRPGQCWLLQLNGNMDLGQR